MAAPPTISRSQIDDALPRGTDISRAAARPARQLHQPGVARRNVALDRLNRPSSAMAMFDRYAHAAAGRCRSRPRAITGPGARRWRPASSRPPTPISSAPRPIPNCSMASSRSSGWAARCRRRRRRCRNIRRPPAQRAAFNANRLVQAVQAPRPAAAIDRAGAVREGARRIARQRRRPRTCGRAWPADRPPGPAVWVARMARVKGSMFYVRQAYPTLRLVSRRTTGRWPTASAARKARSTPMPSATPARAG